MIISKVRSPGWISALLILITGPAYATISVQADLNLSGYINVEHHAAVRGGACGGGNKSYDGPSNTYTAPLRFDTKTSQVNDAFIRSKPIRPVYRVETRTDLSPANENQRLTFTIKEDFVKNSSIIYKAKKKSCETNYWTETANSAGYFGKIKVKYEVPEGVWVVWVTEGPTNDVFTSTGIGEFGNTLLSSRNGRTQTLWVKPGSTIEKTIEVNASANQQRGPVTYQIQIEEQSWAMKADVIRGLITSGSLPKYIDQVLNESSDPKLAVKAIETFNVLSASLLRSRTELAEALRTLPLTQMKALSEQLHALANVVLKVTRPDLEMTLKTAAALLSYEVASLFTEELAPFCQEKEVTLPHTQVAAKVSGKRYANYLLVRMSARLDPKILDTHQTFLDQLVDLRTRGFTYARAASDESVRARLTQSFKLLNTVTANQPFTQAREDLVELYQAFPSLAADQTSRTDLLGKLQDLAKGEASYGTALRRQKRLYTEDNTSPIETAELEKGLAAMRPLLSEVKALISQQMTFLAVDRDADTKSLSALMMHLQTHNLNIVANTYADVPFNFEFERVRAAYVDPARTARNVETINACVYEGAK